MEHFFPFNSVNHDRKYKAEDWAEYFNPILTNGIFPSPSTNLQVTADGTSMKIAVQTGKAWINGYGYYNDTLLNFQLANADGAMSRIDRVVIRWSRADRSITLAVKQGTYAATTPNAPTLQRDADIYELAIADIYAGAGVTNISQANVTDQRPNIDLCGWVNSLIHIDTKTLYDQFTAQFNEWFANIKTQLGNDVVGHLQNEIDGKATKSTIVAATLLAANWVGTTSPYSQTLSVSQVTATSVNEILPGTSITADQLNVLQGANLQDGGQAAGSLTIQAYDDKPAIDLPIRVIIRGDM